jgi:hypothetical protein
MPPRRILDLRAGYLAGVAPSGNVLALVAGLCDRLAAAVKTKDSIAFSIIISRVLFAKCKDCTYIFIFPRVLNVILYTLLE